MTDAFRLAIELNGEKYELGYLSNRPLATPDSSVRSAVIVVHGTTRDAPGYFASAKTAATIDREKGALIITPQFPIESDLPKSDSRPSLFWSSAGWKQGDLSLSSRRHPRQSRISSFAVVDTLVARITRPGLFPSLSRIVIIGHSAGGQFVNRYAAGSAIESVVRRRGRIRICYVVANPSSYLYLDARRPSRRDPGSFVVPVASTCPRFNRYKYGLDALNSYMAKAGVAAIRWQFGLRSVVYLVGERDTAEDEELDQSCEARLQGGNRFLRGTNYIAYIRRFYRDAEPPHHRLEVVPGVGHDAHGMLCSKEARRCMFGP